jgi:ribonuclease-3
MTSDPKKREAFLAALLARLDLPSPPLLDEALTHRSFANERRGRGHRLRDNQRLEFLGDAVLNLCVSELLMAAFPDADEGLLSRMRSNLVNADLLAEYGRSIDLGQALRLGRGAQSSGDHQQSNVLADAVEALVGAVYLDGGLPSARGLVRQVVAEGLRNATELRGADPKSALQEEIQGRKEQVPVYQVTGAEGPEQDRWFHVEVRTGERLLGQGRGRSKKLAEHAAARDALARIAALSPSPTEPSTASPSPAPSPGSASPPPSPAPASPSPAPSSNGSTP